MSDMLYGELETKRNRAPGTVCDSCGVKAKDKKFPSVGKNRHLCQNCLRENQENSSVPYRKPKKITPQRFNEFRRKFFEGSYPHQRFGQAFLNQLFPNIVDPTLFYEENEEIAQGIAYTTYVNFQ